MSKKLLFIAAIIIGLTSCQVVVLENDENNLGAEFENWDWNHTGILGFVTYNNNFHIEDLCFKKIGNKFLLASTKVPFMHKLECRF